MQAASKYDKAKEFSLNKSEMEYEWHYWGHQQSTEQIKWYPKNARAITIILLIGLWPNTVHSFVWECALKAKHFTTAY